MELLFIDESGDDGLAPKSSEFYILAGVAVEDCFWKETFWKLFGFRQHILRKFGLKIDELKGEDIFHHEGDLFNTKLEPTDEKWICESLIELICAELKVGLHIWAKSKRKFLQRYTEPLRNPQKIFRQEIWREYLSRYEQHLFEKSHSRGYPQNAMVFYDKNQQKHVRSLIREFTRKFDEQSEFPGAGLIEDVIFYDSKMSVFIQLADFLASISLRILKGRGSKDEFEIPVEFIERIKAKIGNPILI
jgi:hypothetical protein